ncbi:MAG TPA: beta-galactosidase [Abditibacteriaceae bacterium]
MIYYGASWYPEQWPESEWARDLQQMRDARMNVVRMAEFAWSRMEPREGEYDFGWLDRAIALAGEKGFSIVLGTPTATPPAWLTTQYPDTLLHTQNGRVAQHGARCHFNRCSVTYRRLASNIAGILAQRYASIPHVIGWQIDNEYNSFSFDEETRGVWQTFLRDRYGDLETLNARWGNAYWSQDYSDWSQIPIQMNGGVNPCHLAAFRRFLTEATRVYQADQIAAIRTHARPDQFITHNFHGDLSDGDPHALSEDLDVASFDYYVGGGHLNAAHEATRLDWVRGFKRKNFWLMETQAGSTNFAPVNNPLDPGETRLLIWNAIGCGADAALYWQWRPCYGGHEQYWGTVVGAHGHPRPIYHEIAEIGVELESASSVLAGTSPRGEVAILYSDDDRWGVAHNRHHHGFEPLAHMHVYHEALRRAGYAVDIVEPTAPLENYPAVFAPNLHLVWDEKTQPLLDYVAGGGHLILGARSGCKTIDNALLTDAVAPGATLGKALGATVQEYYPLETPITVSGEAGQGEATIWAEWLRPEAEDCEVLLRYGAHPWLDGQPALVTRRHGKGRISYLGVWPDNALLDSLLSWLQRVSPLPEPMPMPEGIILHRRRNSSNNGEVRIVLNTTSQGQAVALPGVWRNVLTETTAADSLNLAPRGVAVLVAG